ncbi:MAG: N-(5'-phosphoribosyl)anthranilate isomerase [Siphonobacter aquaeclarae]|nr:N-(5'-phosphoribosyl)anthranilate isomerase [Siphonobacter aquaeclarae]
MALQTLVKISDVTNLSDARYCAGMGVEWLGFSMDTLSLEKFQEIRGWLAGVSIVGETISADFSAIRELVERYQPDVVQIIHPELLPAAKTLGLPVILRIDLADGLPASPDGADYYLIDHSDPFAHLDVPTLNYLDPFAFRYPTLIGFGLNVMNVKEVLKQIPFKGIALTGGEETRPGYKDFGEMMDMLELLEED